MRALLLGALLTSLLGSEASAQRRLRVLGTLAADSVTFRVAVRDDGDAGVLATHGASNMWCGADPRTIRDWVRGSRMMFDSAVAIGGRGPTLSGACGIRLLRTAEGAEIELAEPGGPTRVSARTSSQDAKRLLGWLDAAADSGDVAPAAAPSRPAYFEFQVERLASPLPGSPQPTYPPELRSAKIGGEVLAQFVVDTSGFVELGSFKVLKSTHALFTQAVRQT